MWLPSSRTEDMENKKTMEFPPQFFNGWIPVSGKRTGDVKQQDKDDQKSKQFQWPIIWMPAGYDEKRQAKELKEMDESPKISEESPPSPKIKIIPLSWFEDGHSDQKPSVKDESHHNERSTLKKQSTSTEHQDGRAIENIQLMPKKVSEEKKPIRENYKTIPVMPRHEDEENKTAGGNYRTIPVMSVKETDDREADVSVQKGGKKINSTEKEEENGKRSNEGTSKAKHSKLPPVCLRVEPLPRKKSGKGSSRSPSPPTRKDGDRAKKELKEAHIQKEETKQSDPKKEVAISEVQEKAPAEMNKERAYSNETKQAASVKHMQEEQASTSLDDQKVQATRVDFNAQENAGQKNLQESEKNTEHKIKIQGEPAKDNSNTSRISFSEPDAAVCIQSAYRGYNVRRWQPLEKLRMIKNVNELMIDLKKQLQDLEASSKQLSVKEQVTINETIMNLLLKLDTIQGLHPSVREARKTVARELISLQEKLDSLCKQPSSESNQTDGEQEKPEQEKASGVDEEQGPFVIDSKELISDAVPSVASTGTTQDAHSNDHIEDSNTTKEEIPNEGKAATQCDCQGDPSMDMIGDVALLGHSTDQKHQIGESNSISSDKSYEREKDEAWVGGQEIPSGDHMEPLHDEALSESSNELEQCTTRSNTVISPMATDNSTIHVVATSVESGMAADKGSPVEGQVPEAAAVESSESEHYVAPAEEGQCEEPNAQGVDLEDSSVSLMNEGLQDHDPAPSGCTGKPNSAEQPETASDVNMEQQVENVGITQDATEESDATPVVGMGHVISADTENYVQSTLLQTISELQPTTEQDALEEAVAANKGMVSGDEDDSVLFGKQNGSAANLPGDSANAEEPPIEALGMEVDIHESTLREMKDDPIFPEMNGCELPCEQGGITGHEDSEICVSPEHQANVHKEFCSDDGRCADVQVPKEGECNIVGADNLKEDVSVQTENMASEEASLASGTPDDLKVDNKVHEETSDCVTRNVSKSDNENKLAEENQRLKEMLQKLLPSGSDQMAVITELSEKVKTLERKLARKKKPKVRVHRPARQAAAKVH
ncbi:BAG family molecular chaperone regulator 6 isoform X2 [Oryza brachyantha]|uniref:BAG domain-containing protein n=1 Tax=Oryza brachyantha TaxID=4533 RepID=J3LBI3_ORYBR|nr:BAG family molecular chaperone regulator 6 isoform X2 [Oryza brachyantha]